MICNAWLNTARGQKERNVAKSYCVRAAQGKLSKSQATGTKSRGESCMMKHIKTVRSSHLFYPQMA